ncbi:MAG TPA: hypothetical protein VIZ17_05125 [Acetobacteraceae bacterium]
MRVNARSGLATAALLVVVAAAPLPAAHRVPHPRDTSSVQGQVTAYSVTPRGDVDGLILDNGQQVHLPPHLSVALVFAVRPGDTVTVQGTKPKDGSVVDAVSVTNDKTGQKVERMPAGQADAASMQAEGPIKLQLYDPRGQLNGVMLADGTQIYLPPSAAEARAADLAPGHSLYVEGTGYAGPLGKSIAARELGADKASAAMVEDVAGSSSPSHPARHPKKTGGDESAE